MEAKMKSFVMYSEVANTLQYLTNEQAGILFKMIVDFANGKEVKSDNLVINLAFEPIKANIIRNHKKWEDAEEKRKMVSAYGNLKRWNVTLYNDVKAGKISLEDAVEIQKNNKSYPDGINGIPKHPEASRSIPKHPVYPLNGNVNGNVNVNGNGNVSKERVSDQTANARTRTHTRKDKTFDEKKQKFLEWFNQQKKVHTGVKGRVRTLSPTDENNLKRLLEGNYTIEELNKAFAEMCKDDWVIKNQMLTVSHFLRLDNFNKYLSRSERKWQPNII